MNKTKRVFLYFSLWVMLALTAVVLNVWNIDWTKTNIVQGVVVVIILGVLQGSVLEFPVQTITTLIIGGGRRHNARVEADNLTLVLNYNILALSKDDIDECLNTMYEAYMGNLSELISAVLVSATNDEELKKYELEVRDNYRALIYDELFREGLNFAAGDLSGVDPLRLQHVWSRYEHINKNVFAREYLDGICDEFAREFMVVHRVSRVLRKCGQYQDLMLLSEGDDEAYTYTDPEHYGKQARPYGQPLFHDSEDVENIFNRRFDYTLVLDGDTGVAAANPERGIIQPAIKLHCADTDTMFMHLEAMRQAIYEPMTNALTAMLGQSSFFGKGLIKNRIYIDNVIGTRENLIERVPVDVLSHDTFEAALLRPLYCGSVFLLEAPSYNYVTWNIRERRWNRGEVLLSMYFWKNLLGKPMRWIQSKLQGDKFNATKLRTESKLDFTTSYVAHSALRQMFMKPLLLVYIIIHYNTYLLYRWASIIVVMFLVLVFPKFATCNRHNYKFVLLETVASFLQFTPEAMVGCVRIVRAIQANLVVNAKWVPQRAVEEEFKRSNPFWSSLVHLWGYSVFAVIAGVLVVLFAREAILGLVMLITLALLPLYTGFTSLSPKLRSSRAIAQRRENLEQGAIATIAKPDPKTQVVSGGIPAFVNLGFISEDNRSVASLQRLAIPRPSLYPVLMPTAPSEDILEHSDPAPAEVPTAVTVHDQRTFQSDPSVNPQWASSPSRLLTDNIQSVRL
ncbi:hypothetical protein BaRGS_00010402 [Batillaria attramentaria]|uniref:Glucans biosynthesis glucosyltransferase H n=1 Tax=Batillaria attramentaria TaxID=370345 RepID=A0ABD0LGT2_9CAEN